MRFWHSMSCLFGGGLLFFGYVLWFFNWQCCFFGARAFIILFCSVCFWFVYLTFQCCGGVCCLFHLAFGIQWIPRARSMLRKRWFCSCIPSVVFLNARGSWEQWAFAMEGTRVLIFAHTAAVKHMFLYEGLQTCRVDDVLFGQRAIGKGQCGQGLGDSPGLWSTSWGVS